MRFFELRKRKFFLIPYSQASNIVIQGKYVDYTIKFQDDITCLFAKKIIDDNRKASKETEKLLISRCLEQSEKDIPQIVQF